MDDTQIVDLFFARNEKAIEETDTKYGKSSFGLAHNILKNVSDSEECVNDTYLTLWNAIPPARPYKLKAFILKITRNLALKKLEYNTAQKRTPDILVSFSEIENVISSDSLNSSMGDKEIADYICTFLWRTKLDLRKVFVRRYFFFESISDIASRYGYSESKVKNMLYRTRNQLKKYLIMEGVVL